MPGYKLNFEDVLCIRYLYSRGSTVQELANEYNVTPQNIGLILKRKTWKKAEDVGV